MPKKQGILKKLDDAFSSLVPDSKTIANAAMEEILTPEVEALWIKQHVSELVERLQIDAYNKYLRLEQEAWRTAFADAFEPELQHCQTPEQVSEVIGSHFQTLDRFFLSRTQSRRARAGTAFEVVLFALLTRLKYPFTFQPKIDGKPDFVLPSVEYYLQNAPDAIVFTAKRSLRERWRQIVTEGARGLGFYLATIDENVTPSSIDEMKAARIHLVVPKRVKEAVAHYANAVNVVSFEDFLEDHLDPKMTKWKKHGIIE